MHNHTITYLILLIHIFICYNKCSHKGTCSNCLQAFIRIRKSCFLAKTLLAVQQENIVNDTILYFYLI